MNANDYIVGFRAVNFTFPAPLPYDKWVEVRKAFPEVFYMLDFDEVTDTAKELGGPERMYLISVIGESSDAYGRSYNFDPQFAEFIALMVNELNADFNEFTFDMASYMDPMSVYQYTVTADGKVWKDVYKFSPSGNPKQIQAKQ